MAQRSSGLATAGLVLSSAVLLAGAAPSSSLSPAAQHPGSTTLRSAAAASGQGIGDPYYPADGNRGYNVTSYFVRLNYYRPTERISARTTIRSVATTRLDRFHLDLRGLHVLAVTVDGHRAQFSRSGAHELVVTPRRAIADGNRFATVVSYRGKPGSVSDQVPSGWFDAHTPGAGFIAGEPHSCTLWYPCNDHPTDKARFRLTATVPRPFKVVSVGKQARTTASTRPNGTAVRTYRWRLKEKTATYLTTIYIDKLTFDRSKLADGTPVVSAYGPDQARAARAEKRLPKILRLLSHRWGRYPAPQAGGIFVDARVPFSLEIFTRPLYTTGAGLQTIAHENGHQWWGDNVSIKGWRDICFNECLASYSQWLWDEHNGVHLDRKYRRGIRNDSSLFDPPLYDMGPGHEFDYAVYYKGPFFVHALRNKLGDVRFFSAMRRIQRQHAGGNMSMLQLRDALEHATGVDLTSFWRQWVLHTGRPSRANLYPGDL
jgi:aminopeptidase N